MKTVNIPDKNVSLAAIDKSLDKLKYKAMPPEKLEKANRLSKNAKLPAKKNNTANNQSLALTKGLKAIAIMNNLPRPYGKASICLSSMGL